MVARIEQNSSHVRAGGEDGEHFRGRLLIAEAQRRRGGGRQDLAQHRQVPAHGDARGKLIVDQNGRAGYNQGRGDGHQDNEPQLVLNRKIAIIQRGRHFSAFVTEVARLRSLELMRKRCSCAAR